MEVEKGGHWRYVEHSPEGTHGFEGRYAEVVNTSLFFTAAERDGMLATGMETGLNESYAALDRLLAEGT